MKTMLLTVVLGVAVSAVGQNPAQPAQTQPAAPAQSGSQNAQPVIKDPAEYNAYVAAVQQKDNNAKISGLEAFVTQYPNSVMKNQAIELLMTSYQQAGNVKKTMETAQKLVTVDPCNLRGLTLLAFYDRALALNGDPNGAQLLTDGKKYGEQGLECLPKVNDPEIDKMKPQMAGAFHAAIGQKDLQDKDDANAAKELKEALDTSADTQKDFGLVYPLALAYLSENPPDYQNGIWYAARATALAPAAAEPQIEKYAKSQYVKFHAGDDGWTDVLAAAKAGGPQVPIKPAPTPAEQAHNMVVATSPDKMDFATWEFVLSNGNQADQDTVWNAIKGKPVQMNGTIISTQPEQFMIAGSSDDIDAKKADITLNFEEKVPVRMIPKDGASFDFQGEPSSYTPATATAPFMMVMDKGELLRQKPAAPTHPTHRKAAQ
ncbi:MAG TPA: hypothetical protein VMX38_14555 [Verrucomicrobiae bacterium]|jgi:hypothetical protein|nr:hypothetical protein [Verrucomicrobiae bacterium]